MNKPTSFLHHNQIFDVIVTFPIMISKFNYDVESPWAFGPIKLDMWTLDRVIPTSGEPFHVLWYKQLLSLFQAVHEVLQFVEYSADQLVHLTVKILYRYVAK